ncbi:hypothetical protein BC827DRAFT_1239768 [Russula dissimulans]|nr:hypothetical protein BC827DRAFT_1239768 [Russula dissimulans]
MEISFLVYVYRYYLFAITIISSAIICSAAAWNLPISQSIALHTQVHIVVYMVFLGAFSLLVVIPIIFLDIFSRRPFTSQVWVECLWIDSLWLLHFVGAIIVTTQLPRDMCTPQAESIDRNSCTSVKLLMAFSWICTINLFIYLVFLVFSSILHQTRNDTVWSSQVRSFPWYLHTYCHKLESSPELSARERHAPIPAPQPRRPIRLLRLSVLSSLYRPERTPDRESGVIERSAPQMTVQQERPVSMVAVPTTLYPLHVQTVLAPTPSSPGWAISSPRSSHAQRHSGSSLADSGGPPPLLNWPRPDIMSRPPPKRMIARMTVAASAIPSVTELQREMGEHPPLSLSPNTTQFSPGSRHVR